MESNLYPILAKVEKQHWWFVARRAIISKMLKSIKLPSEANILEAGCGTGGNLKMLSQFGKVSAIEIDDNARQIANDKNIAKVQYGKMPDELPFENNIFDVTALFDVLEHIDDDKKSLEILHGKTKKNGYLILTVPAFPILWSSHDEQHHHKRRYMRNELVEKVEQAGFTLTYASYYSFWLFPAILSVRLISKTFESFRKISSKENKGLDIKIPPKFLNNLLTKIFSSEGFLLEKRKKLPFGSSIILIAQKQ